MDTYFECLMVAMFCLSLVMILVRFVKHNESITKIQRITVLTMWIGFIVGTIGKVIQGANIVAVMFYLAGAMLAYTAFILSLPDSVIERI